MPTWSGSCTGAGTDSPEPVDHRFDRLSRRSSQTPTGREPNRKAAACVGTERPLAATTNLRDTAGWCPSRSASAGALGRSVLGAAIDELANQVDADAMVFDATLAFGRLRSRRGSRRSNRRVNARRYPSSSVCKKNRASSAAPLAMAPVALRTLRGRTSSSVANSRVRAVRPVVRRAVRVEVIRENLLALCDLLYDPRPKRVVRRQIALSPVALHLDEAARDRPASNVRSKKAQIGSLEADLIAEFVRAALQHTVQLRCASREHDLVLEDALMLQIEP